MNPSSKRDQILDDVWAELTGPGAPFEVSTVQVRGQALRRYVQAPPTVREVWEATTIFADRDYLLFNEERITYAEAHAATSAIAAWLAGHGVRSGDRVAIAMRNYPEWLLIYWACLSSGVVAVGMNAWWVPAEMAYALQDAAPKVIFCDAERLERLGAVAQRPSNLTVVAVRCAPAAGAIGWNEVVAGTGAAPRPAIDPDDDACIFYTSGTTGAPKGAQLTHLGCVNTLMSLAFSAQAHLLANARMSDTPDGQAAPAPAPIPVGLVTTPLFHVTANNCLAYTVTAAGGTLVLMYKWDAGAALRLIATERVTTVSGVPTMARELITHPDAPAFDLSSLLSLSGGGAQLPPDLVSKIAAHPSPMRPGTGYGMTEMCGIITAIGGDFLTDRPESCGRALPTCELRLVDDLDRPVAPGALGEVCVRGAGLIKGYINRPEATAAAIIDGWLHTGDIGRIDEQGFLFLVDRKKDMILRGGENVYCAEVEAALFRHPAVAETCVFGVPDERLGEEVGAAVVCRAGEMVTAEALRDHVAGLLARYKVPRYVWLLAEKLPRNANGKFLRRELRSRLVGSKQSFFEKKDQKTLTL